jgi:hypothetical protein
MTRMVHHRVRADLSIAQVTLARHLLEKVAWRKIKNR